MTPPMGHPPSNPIINTRQVLRPPNFRVVPCAVARRVITHHVTQATRTAMNRLSATCWYISNLKTSRTRTLALVLSAAFLGGCATFSEDGGFGNVEILTRERIGQAAKWIKNERDAGQRSEERR